MPDLLDDAALAAGLSRLTGWAVQDGKLCRSFRFRDFAEAFGFMAACAVVAEGLQHHPEWSNVYATVNVALVTHDAGGLTALDLQLATRMSQLAGDRGAA